MLPTGGTRRWLGAGGLFLACAGMAACSLVAAPATATLVPRPATPSLTATALPPTATPTATDLPPDPTVPATPSMTSPPPSPSPTPFPITLEPEESPTPETVLPSSAIQILAPGPLSKAVSPINAHLFLEPGSGGRVRVELFGEDGRLLFRQLLVYPALPGRRVNLFPEIDFEIAAVAEAARLSVSIDDRWGRTVQLASVDLVLLSSGQADINPPGDLLAPIILEEPLPDAVIEGGEVLVVGLARPNGEQPLVIELVTREGKILGSRLAAIAEGDPAEHRPFAVSVPYQVESATRALLVARERGERIPGNAQLTSLEIVIEPE